MPTRKPKALLAWSSGKDAAWSLHILRERDEVEVVGLLTTFNEAFDRVAMHAVRSELVERQADAADLPLYRLWLPWPCSHEEYEARMRSAISDAGARGITRLAFGDLYLPDVRAHRVALLAGSGVEPIFPIWGTAADTPGLARTMTGGGLGAILTCVDPRRLAPSFVGLRYDAELLSKLPASVDPCGEGGEFHTFCYSCPSFRSDVAVTVGEVVLRDGFWFADLIPGL